MTEEKKALSITQQELDAIVTSRESMNLYPLTQDEPEEATPTTHFHQTLDDAVENKTRDVFLTPDEDEYKELLDDYNRSRALEPLVGIEAWSLVKYIANQDLQVAELALVQSRNLPAVKAEELRQEVFRKQNTIDFLNRIELLATHAPQPQFQKQ